MTTHSNILHILYMDNRKLNLIQAPEHSVVYLENGGLSIDNYFEYIPEDRATYQNRELSENKLVIDNSDLILYGLPSAFRFGDSLVEVSAKEINEVVTRYIDHEFIKDLRDYNSLSVLNTSLGSPITEESFVVDDIFIKYYGELIERDSNRIVFKVKPYFGDVYIGTTLTVYREGDGVLRVGGGSYNKPSETISIDKGTKIYLIS